MGTTSFEIFPLFRSILKLCAECRLQLFEFQWWSDAAHALVLETTCRHEDVVVRLDLRKPTKVSMTLKVPGLRLIVK